MLYLSSCLELSSFHCCSTLRQHYSDSFEASLFDSVFQFIFWNHACLLDHRRRGCIGSPSKWFVLFWRLDIRDMHWGSDRHESGIYIGWITTDACLASISLGWNCFVCPPPSGQFLVFFFLLSFLTTFTTLLEPTYQRVIEAWASLNPSASRFNFLSSQAQMLRSRAFWLEIQGNLLSVNHCQFCGNVSFILLILWK